MTTCLEETTSCQAEHQAAAPEIASTVRSLRSGAPQPGNVGQVLRTVGQHAEGVPTVTVVLNVDVPTLAGVTGQPVPPCPGWMVHVITPPGQPGEAEAEQAVRSAITGCGGTLASWKNQYVGATSRFELPPINEVGVAIAPPVAPCVTSLLIDSDLAFGLDSADLTTQGIEAIDGIAASLSAASAASGWEGIDIEVVGHADASTGTPEHNLDLSRRRAETVKDALVRSPAGGGVPPHLVSVGAAGDTQPIPGASPEANRRVELAVRDRSAQCAGPVAK